MSKWIEILPSVGVSVGAKLTSCAVVAEKAPRQIGPFTR
jgi:hypothetical protein